MSITKFSIDQSRLTALLIISIIIIGVFTFLGMPSQEDPTITIRNAKITAHYPGMAARRVEDLITRKIEEKIREIPEIERITSVAKSGSTIITVTVYERYFDLDSIWRKLREKMQDLQPDLPSGTKGPFVNDDFGVVSIATLAITGEGFSLAEIRQTARRMRDRLYAVKGIKRIEVHGIQNERIFLETTNARLAQYGLTPASLVNALQTQNIILPGGKVSTRGQDILIEPSGNFSSVKDIGQVVIAIPSSQSVAYLRDILTIRRTYIDPPEKKVYFNGQPAVVLGVSMIAGENIIKFGKRLRVKLKALENNLPVGYVVHFATFQPDLVRASIDDFSGNLYQALVIVLVVVIVFLGLRTGLIVGMIVPLTMLMSVIIMRQLDIELHRVSIASLVISLGLLVDNGIVVAEDIRRRIEHGDDRKEAAIAAGRELATPLLTSSLTTILAFLPLMLADNAAGEFTRSLSLVIMITLLSSWFLAMFATPMLCATFIKVRQPAEGTAGSDPYASGFYQRYRVGLEFLLRHRAPFLAVMVFGLIGAGVLFRFVPQQFFPPSDRAQVIVFLDLQAGASARQTDANVKRIANWLDDKKRNPEITSNVAYVGYGGPRFFLSLSPTDPDPHRAFLLVNVKQGADIGEVLYRTRKYILENHPEVRPEVKKMWMGPSEIGIVQYRISGPGAKTLRRMADDLKATIHAIPGITDLKDDWENHVLKVIVQVDQARARRAGITSQEIAESLNNYFSGSVVTDFREGDTIIPVVIRAAQGERFNLDRMRTINIYSQSREKGIPLLQVASFAPKWELSQIRRRDLERTITITTKHGTMKAEALVARLKGAVAALDPPAGYRIELGGEVENSSKAQKALFANLPICLALIFVLMVWQFNSFRRPAIIGLTIPLSLIGAAIGLIVTNATFGFIGMLGLLSLAGIIINNAIVLIDRMEIERASGVAAYDAVVGACLRRLRPILMTTLTTIFGLMPLILFGGDLWFAMAVAISFGLGVGTVLTLAVVPVLYTYFFRVPIPKRT